MIDLNGKTILVTGGTGSFGRVFANVVLERYDVKKLIIYSRDELKQYEMAQNANLAKHLNKLRFLIGDVRDQDRLEMALRNVDYVIHAAALKQIPAAEYNPFECIRTNVHGAENVAKAAMRTGVKRVIALSTDKAANPVNLYGASKLASDKIFVAAKALVGEGDPLFTVVRYGNVLASRGSVVPYFRRLAASGTTTLPITDFRMTRFWITARQGVEFVLSCLELGRGGEIFVPKLPSMSVKELAGVIAPNLQVEEVGIRPGEKLHEMMLTYEESPNAIELRDRYILQSKPFKEAFKYDADQRPIEEGFVYASNTNPWWLKPDEMAELLVEAERPQD